MWRLLALLSLGPVPLFHSAVAGVAQIDIQRIPQWSDFGTVAGNPDIGNSPVRLGSNSMMLAEGTATPHFMRSGGETETQESRGLAKSFSRRFREPVHLIPIYSSLTTDKYISPFEPSIPVPLPFSGHAVEDLASLIPKATIVSSPLPPVGHLPLQTAHFAGVPVAVMPEATASEQKQQDSPPVASVEPILQTPVEPVVYQPSWPDEIPARSHPEHRVKYYDFQDDSYKPAAWGEDPRGLQGLPSSTSRRELFKDRYTAEVNPWSVRARPQPDMVFYYPQAVVESTEEQKHEEVPELGLQDLLALDPPPPCTGVGCYRRLGPKSKGPKFLAWPEPRPVTAVVEKEKKDRKVKDTKAPSPVEIVYIPLSKEYIPLLAWPVGHSHHAKQGQKLLPHPPTGFGSSSGGDEMQLLSADPRGATHGLPYSLASPQVSSGLGGRANPSEGSPWWGPDLTATGAHGATLGAPAAAAGTQNASGAPEIL
ncbi:hypothetical protein CSUI_000360 [Cystoisospora suis]|uniref:Transmembrane protein n=1 Tax=Cystoisospora suis TaxID=483139 RepID=A0A2C6LGN7_9APIC|nr:hypothetical protein CSUI_000360 [Cystoisospora suis]